LQLSFAIKSSLWSAILDDVVFSMNEIIAGSIFILSTADALHYICISNNTWRDRISCFDKDMVLGNNDNTLEKQTKYEQEEQKHFFQPSWQSKRPWFSFVPGFSL